MIARQPGSRLLLAAFCATLFNCLPAFLVSPGADILFHYANIQCFSSQFWQGDLFPRWCASANSGLGSPAFLFYFPLPYIITALFYPLTLLGVGVEGQYMLSAALATFVTFLTCCFWLRAVVSPGRAMLCALLFIFMPYRMEVMYFRTALAELWCLAFLPLIFAYARKVALGQKGQWLPLAWAIVAAALSHVTVTAIALAACGLQVLYMSKARIKSLSMLAMSAALAVSAIAIYLVPAAYYTRTLHPDALAFMRNVWVNDYMTIERAMPRISVVAGWLVTMLLLVSAMIATLRHTAQIANADTRRELASWLVLSAFALVMILPVSAPLWDVFFAVTGIKTPWRAQVIFPFALTFFIAVKAQWLMTEKKLKTWKSDYGVLLLMFVLLGLSVLTTRLPEEASLYRQVIASQVVGANEYRSRWTDEASFDREKIVARYDAQKPLHRTRVLSGSADISIEKWNGRGITLQVDAKKDSVIVLEHFYFPLWRAELDGVDADIIQPSGKEGYIALRVPAGKHTLALSLDLSYTMGIVYSAACFASMLGMTVLMYFLYRQRRQRVAN
jgi:hypothetical protein